MPEELLLIALIVVALSGVPQEKLDNAPVYTECGLGEERRGTIISAENKILRPAKCVKKEIKEKNIKND